MSGEGKLLLIEYVLTPADASDVATRGWNSAWVDLTMLVLLTGLERSEAEFRALYAAAGFKLTRVIPAGGGAIIEGVPV
jgi:hypothetical protein